LDLIEDIISSDDNVTEKVTKIQINDFNSSIKFQDDFDEFSEEFTEKRFFIFLI
jgi:hypothetical protein